MFFPDCESRFSSEICRALQTFSPSFLLLSILLTRSAMGCGMSTGDSRAKARNDEIERQIKNDRDRMAREVKLLLLGMI